MKVKVNGWELQRALKRLSVIDKKIISKDLETQKGVHIITSSSGINLSVFNLLTSINCIIDGEIEENGQLVIPEKTVKLLEKVNANYITIENDKITADKKNITYRSLPMESYATMKNNADIKDFEVTEKELYRLLEVKYATAQDEIRPILTGVNIQANRFAALDGYTLSVRESKEFNTDLNVTLDSDFYKSIYKLLDKKSDRKIEVYKNEGITNLKFKFKDFEIIGKLLEGEYINYKNIIPEDSKTTIKVTNTKDFIDKLKFMENIKDESNIIVECNINSEDNTFKVKAKSRDNIIEDEIVSEVKGENLIIAFNEKLLLEGINQYKDKELYMSFMSAISPCVLREDDSNNYNLELVLPVRISK